MDLSEDQKSTLGLAKAGDALALKVLKQTFKQPSFARDPHYFGVHPELLYLRDSYKSGPETRSEVMNIPRFAAGREFNGTKYVHNPTYGPPYQVVRLIRLYDSLTSRLAVVAFSEIDELEGELAIYDGKSRSETDDLRKRLAALTIANRPVWENWVLSMKPSGYCRIDDVVKAWLAEPIDMSEKRYFTPGWDNVLYSQDSVKRYLDQIPPIHRAFLGVEWGSFELKTSGKPIQLYVLKESISTANKRVKLLGGSFRFESA